MTDTLPAAIREALYAPFDYGISLQDPRWDKPTKELLADRARFGAVVLRWADANENWLPWVDPRPVIAALEQEATP